MSYVIGVDIGGTTIKAGLVNKGKVLSKAIVKTKASKGASEVIDNIVEAVNSVKLRKLKGRKIGAIILNFEFYTVMLGQIQMNF